MSLNLWGWKESGKLHLGLSANAALEVVDLGVEAGIRSAEELLHAMRARGGSEWLWDLLKRPRRVDVSEKKLVLPVPISEVWGAGVTYERSRDARRNESKGFDAMYLKVYDAQRPELFFKQTGRQLAGTGETMGLRPDACWHVPEPELTLVLAPDGTVFGYTIGNDLTARDLEAENPLYLPQAKIFYKSASLGPNIALHGSVNPAELTIRLSICRRSQVIFQGSVPTRNIRRPLEALVAYLGRAWPLSPWTALMTGTGIVPPDDVALADGDEVQVTIDGIGTLSNRVRTISEDWLQADLI